MLRSKPCERASVGCRELVVRTTQKKLDEARFCSSRCFFQFRVEHGLWNVTCATREDRARGGHSGGSIAGEVKRQLAVRRYVERIEPLLTPDDRGALNGKQLARVKVLLARAFRRGPHDGYYAGYQQGRRERAHDSVSLAAAGGDN